MVTYSQEQYNKLIGFPKPEKKVKDRFSKYKIHKKTTGKKSPKQNQIRRLDTYFKLWVRLSNSDLNGIVRCYTCGKIKHYKDNIHGGHYVGSTRFPTRWDEMNVKPQCFTCNNTNEGRKDVFAKELDKEYGNGTADMLLMKSLEYFKYDSFAMETKIKHYRTLVNKLKKERGIK